MRRALVAGNWKMNGSHSQVTTLLEGMAERLEDVRSSSSYRLLPILFVPSSGCRHYYGDKVLLFQRSSTDQSTIDISLPKNVCGIVWFDTTTV